MDKLRALVDEEETVVMGAMTPGSFFGDRFHIKRSLGTGGMGAVFEAEDLQQGSRPVAIKVLLKGDASESTRQRFQREYEILKAIEHPGIVQILGYGYDNEGNTPWLAMEKLNGQTLSQRVETHGPMNPTELAVILRNVAYALEAAHDKGVIHRDLKPDHIFLEGPNGHTKLIDFGLSLMRDSKKLTATGTVIGTPRYMAPEQIASAHTSGAAADVYALGVVAYEALVGDSPFAASDHGQLLGAILSGRRTPLGTARPELAYLDEVLDRAMAPKLEGRFQTPSAFVDALARAVRKHRKSTSTGEARSWALLVVGVVVSALVGAGLTYILIH